MLHRLARRSILPKPYHIFCETNKVVKKNSDFIQNLKIIFSVL